MLLGILNYYRKFIENFSQIAAPLTTLIKKELRFIFGIDCREAFKELKRRLTAALILAIYDPEKEVILKTDASDYAIGACLTQKGDDGKEPLYEVEEILGYQIKNNKSHYLIHWKGYQYSEDI